MQIYHIAGLNSNLYSKQCLCGKVYERIVHSSSTLEYLTLHY